MINRRVLWWIAKTLEGVGMLIVLVGVFISMNLGFGDEGLASMAAEFQGLMWGGGMFVVGLALERLIKSR